MPATVRISTFSGFVTGSIGLLGSSSVGAEGPGLFEPIHGSAPDIAGLNIANPSGTIASGAMMLEQLGLPDMARVLEAALRSTLLGGKRTADLGGSASCSEFGAAVRAHLEERLARHDAAKIHGRRRDPEGCGNEAATRQCEASATRSGGRHRQRALQRATLGWRERCAHVARLAAGQIGDARDAFPGGSGGQRELGAVERERQRPGRHGAGVADGERALDGDAEPRAPEVLEAARGLERELRPDEKEVVGDHRLGRGEGGGAEAEAHRGDQHGRQEQQHEIGQAEIVIADPGQHSGCGDGGGRHEVIAQGRGARADQVGKRARPGAPPRGLHDADLDPFAHLHQRLLEHECFQVQGRRPLERGQLIQEGFLADPAWPGDRPGSEEGRRRQGRGWRERPGVLRPQAGPADLLTNAQHLAVVALARVRAWYLG